MKNAIEEGKSVSNLLVWVINYSIFCSELAFLLHTIHMQKKNHAKKKKNAKKLNLQVCGGVSNHLWINLEITELQRCSKNATSTKPFLPQSAGLSKARLTKMNFSC